MASFESTECGAQSTDHEICKKLHNHTTNLSCSTRRVKTESHIFCNYFRHFFLIDRNQNRYVDLTQSPKMEDMLNWLFSPVRMHRQVPVIGRRHFIQAGMLGLAPLSLPRLLQAENADLVSRTRPTARNCILFFLEGGPSHIDLWDMKPSAPADIRGEFRPIATSNPEVQVCEHLPLLSRQMHLLTLVRSVHHRVVDHNAGAYYALTGQLPYRSGELIVAPSPDDAPPFGSVMAHLRPSGKQVPSFVHVPDIMSNNGHEIPGEKAGFLGPSADPLVAGDPSVLGYKIPGLGLPAGVSRGRLGQRRALLESLNGHQHTRRAFDLERESDATRRRYGLPDREDRSVGARKFGGLPHLGQSMLLARRLIESGVRLVTVCTGRRYDQSWDTHRQHFPLLKRSLVPYADRAFSALLEDLEQRGMLEETLVVAMGEFGRTPRLGQITSGAGADRAGRDHWPHCYTVMFAGGPLKRGLVHGSSDSIGAYPASHPVTPEDIAATIYHALGIDLETRIRDQLGRPQTLVSGTPILDILA